MAYLPEEMNRPSREVASFVRATWPFSIRPSADEEEQKLWSCSMGCVSATVNTAFGTYITVTTVVSIAITTNELHAFIVKSIQEKLLKTK